MTAAGRRRWPRSTTQVRGGQLTRLVCLVVLAALAHLHLALVAQRNDCLLPTVLQVPGSAANTVEVEMRPNLLLPPPFFLSAAIEVLELNCQAASMSFRSHSLLYRLIEVGCMWAQAPLLNGRGGG